MPRPVPGVRRTLAAALSVGLLACPVQGRAQQAPEIAPTGPSVTPEPAPQTLTPIEVAAQTCPSEGLYDRAVERLADQAYTESEALLERVIRDCPSHPHAAEILRQVRRLAVEQSHEPRGEAVQQPTERGPDPRELYGPEAVSDLARGELVVVQTLHGAYQGALFCAGVGVASHGGCAPWSAVFSSMIGAGLLGAGAFALTNGGIRPGQATVINSGSFWGIVQSVFLLGAMRSPPVGAIVPILSVGGFLGGGIGMAVAALGSPTAGLVGLANSGGLWLGTMSVLTYAAVSNYRLDPTVFGLTGIVGINAGLLLGSLVGSSYRVSRGRVLLGDVGAILGGLLGGSIGTAIGSGVPGGYGTGTGMMVGTALGIGGGFGAAMALTHGLDYPAPAVRATLAPVGPGDGPGMTAGLMF